MTLTTSTLILIAALALVYTLWVARNLLLPIVISILLSFLLRPAVRFLKRRGLRDPVGAALVVIGAACWTLAAYRA